MTVKGYILQSSNEIKLIVGLGNPGSEYSETRHNVGFWFINRLAEKYNINLLKETKFLGFCGNLVIGDKECKLLFPTTYMNLSGQSVLSLTQYYKISVSNVLVCHDDLDFDCGVVRLKLGGGHGGHNGLQNIIKCLGNRDFYRLRIGIGHPGSSDLVHNYVLSCPSKNEKLQITQGLDKAENALLELLDGDIDKAQRILHCE